MSAPENKAGPDGGMPAPAHAPYPGGYVVRASPVPEGEPVRVRTRLGELEGVRADGLLHFRGVPYARPPVGALRFRRAEPMPAWAGVRRALRNPPAPLQTSALAEAETSEDCLYLNLWAPDRPGPHPVYVYIHGGGNQSGYALEHRIDGARFARDGVVCVTVGYRVGVLGFLDLAGWLGPGYRGSANQGLHDQIQALHWVREHIAEWGGDPTRITVGGQSAGGFNVLSLMASPLARGLFQGAISQSGSGHGLCEPDQAQAASERFMQALRAQGDAPEQLPTLAADRILQAERQSIRMGELNGMIDGECLQAHPCEVARQGGTRGVRLLIGANRDETRLFGPTDPARLDERHQQALNAYRTWYPGVSEPDLAARVASDGLMGAPSALMARQHALGGGTVHAYRWELPAPNGPFQGLAIHGIETPLVWDHPEALAFRYIEVPARWHALARQAHQAWTGFITRGEPQAEGWPEWPRFQVHDPAALCVDETPRVQRWSEAERVLWQGLLGRV